MRIIMKVSGEALKKESSISVSMLQQVLEEVKEISKDNEVLLVVGGGNLWRGRDNLDISPSYSDNIGMLATIMNGIALASYFNEHEVLTDLYTAFNIEGIGKRYSYNEVINSLKNKRVVVLSGGLGIPNFSTDMVTVQKAVELSCDLILMAKNVDGVYDKDPKQFDAKKYDVISHEELLNIHLKSGVDKLGVIDLEAMIMLCKHKIPVYFYSLKTKNGASLYFKGTPTGTIVRS